MTKHVVTAAVATRQNPAPRRARWDRDYKALLGRARVLLLEAAATTGDTALATPFGDADLDEVVVLLEVGVDALFDQLDAPRRGRPISATSTLIAAMYRCLRELRDYGAERRLHGLMAVQEGLTRLHAAATMGRLLEMAPRELCASCGVERCVVFRVEGSELVATGVHVVGDAARAAELLAYATEHPLPLTSLVIETEMLRRRAPAIIHDAVADPRTFMPFVDVFQTTSYVAAPVIFETRVIGFVHADYGTSGRAVDTIDRDQLWAFAEGFAWAVERATLMERVEAQRDHVRRMLASTEAVLDELSASGVAILPGGQPTGTVAAVARMVVPDLAPDTPLQSLLTSREREVLALLGTGATNAEIARQLVIAEGTVKSHVKHVLRKLRASNRAEAVSRYLRLVAQDGSR